MFQQSLFGSRTGRKSWSFAVSLLAQSLAVCLVLLATVAYTPLLPAARFVSVILEPPKPPAGAPPKPEQIVVIQPQRYSAELRQPTKIPDRVTQLVDPADPPRISDPSAAGVVGAGPGVLDGVIGSFATSVAPPVKPPEPPKVEQAPELASGPVRVSSSLQAAKLIRRVEPVYSRIAIQTRTSGKVRLRAIISTEGLVEQLNVLSGHPLLIPSAVAAVKQWRYRPTLLNGTPVQVSTEIEVNFVLR